MKLNALWLGTVVFFLGVQTIAAETPEEKGLEIAEKAEAMDAGFGDYVVEGFMTLKSRGGREANRKFQLSALEVKDDGDKRLIVLSQPRDVKGTVSLTHTRGLEPDDQWLYLPAVRRTKRLSARDKTGSFVGSEFAFEDLSSYELKKYTYKYLKDDVVDGRDCYVREDIPAYQFSGYTRIINWIDKENYRSRKIIYYNLQEKPSKQLHFYDFKQYKGKYWRPDRAVMTNLKNGNSTTIEWKNYRFGNGLADHHFAPTRLQQVAR